MKVAHSKTHPLTFGPFSWRQVFGLLWMKVQRKRPLILIGVRVRAESTGSGRKTRVTTEVTASAMQIRDENKLAADLSAELAARTGPG